ncbi:hypothetical protein [Mycobacterium kansasii]|uniref:hypothetical protein n=1 Tax=Mycobacterium kansasii TaxID=1768 RepID=UPI0004D732AB|nr:hypothetical protein [Mycobacterium kansasii]KEP41877.1 hypothetical protein MKSMC1_28750 [Mycobacterium kansasii]
MSAIISTPVRARWLPRLLSGKPHQLIGDTHAPYLLRWYLLPPNRHLNLYLHQFHRSDDPPELHDHPWDFASLVIAGSYVEITETSAAPRRPGTVAIRRAEHRHRIQLRCGPSGRPRRCWSLVLTGPHRRQWGFWSPTADGPPRFTPGQMFGTTDPATQPTHHETRVEP